MNNSAVEVIGRRRFFGSLRELLSRCVYHPHAIVWLNVVSFIESSFFPLPPDLMIIPLLLAKPEKAWWVAFTCSVSSVLGGILGYAIGYYVYEAIGSSIVRIYHLEESFSTFQTQFQLWGFWIIMLKGLTPIPYKLVTIASGVAKLDFGKFILASLITRSCRFYILSALLWKFGPAARVYIERYMGWILGGVLFVIVAGYFLVKVLVS